MRAEPLLDPTASPPRAPSSGELAACRGGRRRGGCDAGGSSGSGSVSWEAGGNDDASRDSDSDDGDDDGGGKYNCFQLVALGVGAVISGNFFGWQNCLVGGVGGTLVGLGPVAVMYAVLSASIAELCAVLPHADGPFGFLAATVGPRSALCAGFAETIKIVATCAVVVDGVASYLLDGVLATALSAEVRASAWISPALWAGVIVLFTTANSFGATTSVALQVVMFVATMAMLMAFYAVAAASPVGQPLNFSRWALGVYSDDPTSNGTGTSSVVNEYFPAGVWTGSLLSLPFNLWWFLGIEELPLVESLARDPARDMPRALGTTMVVLTVVALLTLFVSCSLPPGVPGLLASDSPMVASLQGIFCPPNASLPLVFPPSAAGSGSSGGGVANTSGCATPLQQTVVEWASPFLVLGLACSLYSFIFCCGQILRAISAESYYPRCLQGRTPSARSLTGSGSTHHGGGGGGSSGGGSPVVALQVGGVLIFATLLLLYAAMGPGAVNAMSAPLVSLALLGACTSYVMQLAAFISARRRRRQHELLEAAAAADLDSAAAADGDAAAAAGAGRGELPADAAPSAATAPAKKFHSPFGVPGAVVGIIVAVAVVAAILATGFLNLGLGNSGGSSNSSRTGGSGSTSDAAAKGTLVLNALYFVLLAFVMGYHHLLLLAGGSLMPAGHAVAAVTTVAAEGDERGRNRAAGGSPREGSDDAGSTGGGGGNDEEDGGSGARADARRRCPRVWAVLSCGGQCRCGLVTAGPLRQ